ncbi:MAG: SAM-dependent methyltransferase [Streptomyces sp.]|nr:SAM-dependent methyltransferase [Streptomyces sp.]NUS83178.1 SAM-dependent methyltransferase [Streptomyces sp.]
MSSENTKHIDTTKPHSARMYDYYLGGKDHYRVDEEAARKVMEVYPGIIPCARSNRAFMHRATRWLASEAGIRQFLDIGTAIPTEPNLHQVAQSIAPDARVVYADNDPIVLAYAQALLHGTAEGRTAYIEADVREPESILGSPELLETLDLSEPVALSINATLHFIPDKYGTYEIVERLMDALPSGSYLEISHSSPDFDQASVDAAVAIYRKGGIEAQLRTKSEIEKFFSGLELVEPGIVPPHRWWPDGPVTVTDEEVSFWAGVARKP